MTHLPPLIQDLGIILITAAITTLIFKRLKQPVVLGYLIAGLLVGPHIPFLPNIIETENIKVWAEIGVIFLLFGLGLEFSFKKLAKVGKSAGIAAFVEIIAMLGLGYLLGRGLGWSRMDSIFLGAILSISSTTIIIRAFEELGLKAKGFVSLVFGILIVEDLAAILILVLLTTIASPGQSTDGSVFLSAIRLGFFLLLWFLVGIYCVPLLLAKIKKLLSDETLLIISIGLCLGMVVTATQVGFSPALGAFVMGSILAETREGHRIEEIIIPVRDLFAAIFFVSVGMMIDPKIIFEHFWIILLIISVTIGGKLFGTGLGALLAGRSLKQSMQAGLSLAQIGEFSFLIAGLGVTLGATSDFLYPIVIAVSAVTTFTTPYMIKYSDPLCSWLEARLPIAFRDRLIRYEAVMNSESKGNRLTLIWKAYGPKILLNTVVVVALSLLVSKFAMPEMMKLFGSYRWLRFLACLTAIFLCAPFLYAIVFSLPSKSVSKNTDQLDQLRKLNFGIVPVRIIFGIILLDGIIAQFTSIQALSGFVLVGLGIIIVVFSKYSEPIYHSFESRFLTNLNEKDDSDTKISKPALAPWDATLTEFIVSPDSELVTKRLEESKLKEKTGITVAMIERGNKMIPAPDRKAILLPYDRLFVLGTDEQLARANALIEAVSPLSDSQSYESFGLESIVLNEDSVFVGKTIRECGLREKVHGLIVGIERNEKRHLNPDSTMVLEKDDRVWIVGDKAEIKKLKT